MAQVSLLKNEHRRLATGRPQYSRIGVVDRHWNSNSSALPRIGSLPEQRPPVRAGSVDEVLAIRCPEWRGRIRRLLVKYLLGGVLSQVQNAMSPVATDRRWPRHAFTIRCKTWLAVLTCVVFIERACRCGQPSSAYDFPRSFRAAQRDEQTLREMS